MPVIDPEKIPVAAMHGYLLGAVTPRPIALASTIDASGNVNLSPFSFFNCFGARPPLLIFSPSRRVRDNTTKHTYENVLEVPEVVIHIVNYRMVQQVSLASTEYEKGVNEFEKAGFTAERSVRVRPPRVKEAPVAMECKVRQVISTGDDGGAGNLILCEVVLMHVSDDVLDQEGRFDPVKLDVVARLGGDWYARIGRESLFKVPKPLEKRGVGIDRLPDLIRESTMLTGNELAQLANVEEIPLLDPLHPIFSDLPTPDDAASEETFRHAKDLISRQRIPAAWQLLLRYVRDKA